MENQNKPDYSIYINGNNPVLEPEEIEIMHAFFRIFENENKRASLEVMTQSIASMEEFNTEIVRRVLVWMSKHSNSQCKFNRYRLPYLYEINNTSANAVR